MNYGEIVEHPHPEIRADHTYIGPLCEESFRACTALMKQTGAVGGCYDFGLGWGWWLRGAWELDEEFSPARPWVPTPEIMAEVESFLFGDDE